MEDEKADEPNGLYTCRRCGLRTSDPNFELCDLGQHYGKYTCPGCGAWIKFVAKPDSERRPQRAKKHQTLVKQFGRGFCELCLCKAESLNHGETLTGHHILEYTKHDGDATADNALIVCTSCHEIVHLLRRQAMRLRGRDALYGEPDENE